MVVVDLDGHPLRYNQMEVYETFVAKQFVRIEVDVPNEEGRGWKRSASSFELDSQKDLGDKWKQDLAAGAKYMLRETWACPLASWFGLRLGVVHSACCIGESQRPAL